MASHSLAGRRVWVAGHRGMVGSAICRRLSRSGCTLLTVDRRDVDLTDQSATRRWIEQARPDTVFLAAGKVGGILANTTYPADFLYDNLMIVTNVIEASRVFGVEKLLFLGSSCIYPKFAEQPIVEEALLTSGLEPTNEWYALAKIAGVKMTSAYRRQYGCNFIAAMPTNLYGPGDNFDLASSHVLPAIIRKVDDAIERGDRQITVWGTGQPRREFLHVDDCADACVHLMEVYDGDLHVNVGCGADITILALTEMVCEIAGFRGEIVHDLGKPDGTPRKLLDCARLSALGWQPKIDLRRGITETNEWFRASRSIGKPGAREMALDQLVS